MKKLILILSLFMALAMQGCVAYVHGEGHDRDHHEHHDHDDHDHH